MQGNFLAPLGRVKMTTKHTPGPWAAFQNRIQSAEGEPIADALMVSDFDTSGEDEANARLIAAAPDLLAALEVVIAHPNNFNFEVVRAAIAKAKGE